VTSVEGWAQTAGLQANDQIVGVNGQQLNNSQQVVTQIQNSVQNNVAVNLVVKRRGEMVTIPVSAGQLAGALNPQTGMINVKTLLSSASTDFSKAVGQVQGPAREQLTKLGSQLDSLSNRLASASPAEVENLRTQLDQLHTDLTTALEQVGADQRAELQAIRDRIKNAVDDLKDARRTAGQPATTTR